MFSSSCLSWAMRIATSSFRIEIGATDKSIGCYLQSYGVTQNIICNHFLSLLYIYGIYIHFKVNISLNKSTFWFISFSHESQSRDFPVKIKVDWRVRAIFLAAGVARAVKVSIFFNAWTVCQDEAYLCFVDEPLGIGKLPEKINELRVENRTRFQRQNQKNVRRVVSVAKSIESFGLHYTITIFLAFLARTVHGESGKWARDFFFIDD